MDWIDAATKFFEIVATGAVTIVAAFYGAKYAFQLEETRVKKQSDEMQVKGVNRVLFDLSRTYNHFLAIRRQFIDDYRNLPECYIAMPAMSDATWSGPTFEFESLAFLLRSSDPNVMGQLALLEQEIATTILLLKQRSDVHINQAQPLLERLFEQHGDMIPERAIRQSLGTRITAILENTTTQIIESVDDILRRTIEMIGVVRGHARPMFPGYPLLDMRPPDDEVATQAPPLAQPE